MLGSALAATLAFSGAAFAFQTPAKQDGKDMKGAADPKAAKDAKGATTKPPAPPAPTAAEIADAKAKGLVWVNTGTKVYHKDGEFYGKTKQGKFMTAADADKAGFRAAKPPAESKKAESKKDAKAAPKK